MTKNEYDDLPTIDEWFRRTTQGEPLFEWDLSVSVENISPFSIDLSGERLGITDSVGLSIQVPLGPSYLEAELLTQGGSNIFLGVGREIGLDALNLDMGLSAEVGWGAGVNGTRFAAQASLGPYSFESSFDVNVDVEFEIGSGSQRLYMEIERSFIRFFLGGWGVEHY